MNQDQEKQPSPEAVESEYLADVSPGERLKNARQALGLTVAEVAAHLKLNEKKIEALERGDAESVAAPVFVAGYLRSYARLLELSEEQVLADFKALTAIESSVEAVASDLASQTYGMESTTLSTGLSAESFAKLKTLALWVVAGLLVLGVLYFLLMNTGMLGESRDVTVSALTTAPMETSPMSHSGSGDGLEGRLENKTDAATPTVEKTDTTVNLEAPSTVVSTTPSTGAVTGSEPEKETTGTEAAVETGIQSELTLFFNDDSWVEVNDARGERLVYLLGKAGMSRTVMGVAPFEVQLGYVPGVEIMYNGVSYDLSRFAGRRSARFHVGDSANRTGGG